MHFIETVLGRYLNDIFPGALVLVGALCLGGIWGILGRVGRSALGTFARVAICIPAIYFGWVALGLVVLVWFRNLQPLDAFVRALVEGPWIVVVVYKAFPRNGGTAALPFLILYGGLKALAISAALVDTEVPILGSWGLAEDVFSFASCAAAYIVFRRRKGHSENPSRIRSP